MLKTYGVKSWVLLLLLLAVFSLPLLAEGPDPGEMTDQEIIAELIANLTERESETTKREETLQQIERELQKREERLKKRESAITGIENYWISLISDMKKRKSLDFLQGFIYGFALGFGIGSTGGVAIGFKIAIHPL